MVCFSLCTMAFIPYSLLFHDRYNQQGREPLNQKASTQNRKEATKHKITQHKPPPPHIYTHADTNYTRHVTMATKQHNKIMCGNLTYRASETIVKSSKLKLVLLCNGFLHCSLKRSCTQAVTEHRLNRLEM